MSRCVSYRIKDEGKEIRAWLKDHLNNDRQKAAMKAFLKDLTHDPWANGAAIYRIDYEGPPVYSVFVTGAGCTCATWLIDDENCTLYIFYIEDLEVTLGRKKD